jgi:hypothetical protein
MKHFEKDPLSLVLTALVVAILLLITKQILFSPRAMEQLGCYLCVGVSALLAMQALLLYKNAKKLATKKHINF